MKNVWASVLLALCLAMLAGCGSNSGGSVAPPPGPAGQVSVTVAPAAVSLRAGQTQQFTSTVVNSTDASVVWAVAGVPGGNATVGTISNTGLYTAPSNLFQRTNVAVMAVANANPNVHGSATVALTFSKDPHFLYVSSGSDDSIEIFSVKESTGVPVPISTISVGAGKNPVALAMDPSGSFLYSLNRGSKDISIFQINTDTGALTAAGSVATPDGPYAMVFSYNFAYVSCDNASDIAAFSVDIATGALSPVRGSPYTMGTKLQGLATSLDGRFLYATDAGGARVYGLKINVADGTLTQISGSPFGAGPGVSSMVTVQGYAYAANRDSGSISNYGVDGTSGMLTYMGVTSTGGNSPELYSSTDTGFVLGVNSGSDNLFALEYGGVLTPGSSPVTTGTQPRAGGTVRNDDYYPWAYVVNSGSGGSPGSIGVYNITYSGATNVITTVPTAANTPTGFAITP